MTKAKTITIQGKQVPLTKKGLPNLVHLSKDAKEIVRKHIAQKKKEKKEVLANELQGILSKLK